MEKYNVEVGLMIEAELEYKLLPVKKIRLFNKFSTHSRMVSPTPIIVIFSVSKFFNMPLISINGLH